MVSVFRISSVKAKRIIDRIYGNKFYQITQFVMIIIADERVSKNRSNGRPSGPIFPRVIPRTVEKTTRPRMFVPSAYSCSIFQFKMLAEVK